LTPGGLASLPLFDGGRRSLVVADEANRKETYSPPELRELGSVEELTRGTGVVVADDGTLGEPVS